MERRKLFDEFLFSLVSLLTAVMNTENMTVSPDADALQSFEEKQKAIEWLTFGVIKQTALHLKG